MARNEPVAEIGCKARINLVTYLNSLRKYGAAAVGDGDLEEPAISD
jgi:hypothetical protein